MSLIKVFSQGGNIPTTMRHHAAEVCLKARESWKTQLPKPINQKKFKASIKCANQMCKTFQNLFKIQKPFKIQVNQTIKSFCSHVALLKRSQSWLLRLCGVKVDFEVKMRTTILKRKTNFSEKIWLSVQKSD